MEVFCWRKGPCDPVAINFQLFLQVKFWSFGINRCMASCVACLFCVAHFSVARRKSATYFPWYWPSTRHRTSWMLVLERTGKWEMDGAKIQEPPKITWIKCALFFSKRNPSKFLGRLFCSKTDPNLRALVLGWIGEFPRKSRQKNTVESGFRFTEPLPFCCSPSRYVKMFGKISWFFWVLGRYRLLHNLDIQIPQGVSGIESFGFKYLLNCSHV